ncbi:MAG: lipid-A-disaccharide synthase N-terminal domain-containing protein [Planctomycetes bacterium]|nr:lipid-A-disaccharide synthase N-terminal domain-containing protein [Planctomycetota bacterium]
MERNVSTPNPTGLNHYWLIFGFSAQALFAGRLVVQWIATEKSRHSVVPESFWWLSLLGGLMLLVYFWRRGDPVGIAGQLFGNVVYIRNIYFLYSDRRLRKAAEIAATSTDAAVAAEPSVADGPLSAASTGSIGSVSSASASASASASNPSRRLLPATHIPERSHAAVPRPVSRCLPSQPAPQSLQTR